MSEETNTTTSEAVEPTTSEEQTQSQQTPSPSDSVTISRQEYAQLMTSLAMLQSQVEQVAEKKAAAETPPPSYAGKDINQLTNAELLELISAHQQQQNQQVINALTQIAVKEEVRELGEMYPDFKSDSKVREAVFQIAEKNTHLSLEQAYLLYKGKNVGTAPPQTQKPSTPPPPADKPGVVASSVSQAKSMSIREAAEAALKALKYEG